MKTAFLCISVFAVAAAGTVFIDTKTSDVSSARIKTTSETVHAGSLTAFDPDRFPAVPDLYAEMHRHYARAFAEQEGFGESRMEPLVQFHSVATFGYHSHRRGQIKVDLKKIELIGILQHPQPRVYVSPYLSTDKVWIEWVADEKASAPREDEATKQYRAKFEEKPATISPASNGKLLARVAKGPKMERFRNTPTRALDEFEVSALAQLKRGEDIAWQMGRDGVRMVGALRATKDCKACHEVKERALLGALSYRLDPWRIFSKAYDKE